MCHVNIPDFKVGHELKCLKTTELDIAKSFHMVNTYQNITWNALCI